jgi:propionyl-CoA carboxylase alpha chain/3-methylcrotonyl-CoA carboxylase alpha subunit/acetyl-CoA/propionyl-CoA carboxylase biotin carboxyl carrier protein
MITGLDLVKAQIEIAADLGLPLRQEEVVANGHSIECRICAENPDGNFMPETGSIDYLDVPEDDHIRFENALDPGQKVTADFDPMIAKLVVHGSDRLEAIENTIDALTDLDILGVVTNVDYLIRVIGHEAFVEGNLHTGFIPQYAEDLAMPELSDEARDHALIAAALGFREFRDLAFGMPEPHASIGRWRN